MTIKRKYLLGFDLGSSSVKASLVDVETGRCSASAFFPKQEAPIKSVKPGWAEQDPEQWWVYAKAALSDVMSQTGAKGEDVAAIGISYQMHGLVCVDKNLKPVRDSIIWCDSRAVPYGDKAFRQLGSEYCLTHLLNSPGNFTAAKLAWVKDNEPEVFSRIYKIMLPGDFLAMKLSGVVNTTIGGLSEGIFWDFKNCEISKPLLDALGLSEDILPQALPAFAIHSHVNAEAAVETGLKEGTPICYRAGDQPNNALSLNVLNPGEIASTAGTSGVVYGMLGDVACDRKSRVGTFAHVNYSPEQTRLGVLLCINGTGILNAWLHRNVMPEYSYQAMNNVAAEAPIGSNGVTVIPFGNGAERVLCNQNPGCSIHGLDFNRHDRSNVIRAAQEGIVFSFYYGMEIMREMGMQINVIHAGKANMFLSPLFRETLAGVSGATIELYDTDGSVGAAKGAGLGCGIYADAGEAFASLTRLEEIEPDVKRSDDYREAYIRWKRTLEKVLDEKG